MDRVGTLDAALDARRYAGLGQFALQHPLDLRQELPGRFAARLDLPHDRLEGVRLEVRERQVLQFAAHLAHAEPQRNRRVDLPRLERDPFLPVPVKSVQCPHVVDAIGQLDQNDPDILNHRQDHLAEGLGLAGFGRVVAEPSDLGHAVDAARDLPSEFPAKQRYRCRRVLDNVVQQPAGQGRFVQAHVGQQVRDLQGVGQVGLPGLALLAPVMLRRERKGPPQQGRILAGSVFQVLPFELCVALRLRPGGPGRRALRRTRGGHGQSSRS